MRKTGDRPDDAAFLALSAAKSEARSIWRLLAIKHDGFRLIARRVGKAVKLYSRGGTEWSRRYPRIAEAIGRLRLSSVVLDGEVLILDQAGGNDFDALWQRTPRPRGSPAGLHLVELNGDDYRHKPSSSASDDWAGCSALLATSCPTSSTLPGGRSGHL